MGKNGLPEDQKSVTEREKRFVSHYLIHLNASKAAAEAGFSEHSCAQIAYQLLQKPSIQAAIQKAMDRRAKRTEITADRVLKELARIAFSDVTSVAEFGPTGVTLKNSEDISEDDRHCISEVGEIPTKEGPAVKVRLWDKLRATELLCKHLGLCVDKKQLELTGKLSFADIIEKANGGGD